VRRLIRALCQRYKAQVFAAADDYQSLPADAEKAVNARRVEDLKEFLGQLDVLTINCPLHETTRGIINKETLSYMKKGAWIVNTVRRFFLRRPTPCLLRR
jgi:lactate dehydrogenase-like 2-hydroxyacid dehydrogenase